MTDRDEDRKNLYAFDGHDVAFGNMECGMEGGGA